jgi:hypothetical protein
MAAARTQEPNERAVLEISSGYSLRESKETLATPI